MYLRKWLLTGSDVARRAVSRIQHYYSDALLTTLLCFRAKTLDIGEQFHHARADRQSRHWLGVFDLSIATEYALLFR